MPIVPTANSCWAAGVYLGEGTLRDRQIIFADKEANLMLGHISPQMIRDKSPELTTLEHAASEYAEPQIIQGTVGGNTQAAKAGDSLVSTGKNKGNSFGLNYIVPTIVSGRTSNLDPSATLAHPNQAVVQVCTNEQVYVIGPIKLPVSGINGYTGPIEWYDQLSLTSNGWMLSGTDIQIRMVSSC